MVEAQGLRYVSVPVTPETLSLADVEAVEKVLADAGARPVLLHCASSNRVGAVWAVIQARKGKSLARGGGGGRGRRGCEPADAGAPCGACWASRRRPAARRRQALAPAGGEASRRR